LSTEQSLSGNASSKQSGSANFSTEQSMSGNKYSEQSGSANLPTEQSMSVDLDYVDAYKFCPVYATDPKIVCYCKECDVTCWKEPYART
jgi:hypothetical protein